MDAVILAVLTAAIGLLCCLIGGLIVFCIMRKNKTETDTKTTIDKSKCDKAHIHAPNKHEYKETITDTATVANSAIEDEREYTSDEDILTHDKKRTISMDLYENDNAMYHNELQHDGMMMNLPTSHPQRMQYALSGKEQEVSDVLKQIEDEDDGATFAVIVTAAYTVPYIARASTIVSTEIGTEPRYLPAIMKHHNSASNASTIATAELDPDDMDDSRSTDLDEEEDTISTLTAINNRCQY